MNKAFLLTLSLIFSASLAFATPTVSIIQPNSNIQITGTYSVQFSVEETDVTSTSLTASLFYDTDTDSGNGNTSIASSIALNETNCGDADFSSANTCTYSWDTSGVSEGQNYYFYAVVANSLAQTGNDFSDTNFGVNNVAPVTSHDAPSTDTNSSTVNVTLSCSDSGSGCASTQYNLDSGGWANYSSPITITGEASHSLQFYSVDVAGNTETTQTVNVVIDLTAPSSASISLPDYTNSATPTFSLSASGAGQMRFSCNGTDFSSPVSYGTSYSGFNITSGEGSCNSNNETKTIHAQFGDNAGNWSSTASDTTVFDTTNPSVPGGIDAVIESTSNIKVTWNSVSDPSGIQKYEVKLDNGSYNSAGNSTSYTFLNVSNGSHIVYVRAVDNAGNASNETSKSISLSTSCSFSITLTVPDYVKPNQSVTIQVSSSGDLVDADLILETEDDSFTLRNNFDGRSFSETHTFKNADEGFATVRLDAADSNGRSCDTSKEIRVDGTLPAVAVFDSPSEGAELTEKVGVIVRGRDDQSGTEKVDLYYRKTGTTNWIKITTINSGIGNLFSFSWTFKTLSSGDYELRAVVKDFAGNEKEAIVKAKLLTDVTIEEETPESGELDALLSQLSILRNGVQDLLDFLALINISLSEKISNDWSKANSKMLEAQNAGEETQAMNAASEAKNLFTGLTNLIQITEDTESVYSYNQEELEAMLKSQGLSEELSQQAISLMQNVSVERKLEIEKIVIDNETFYSLGIVLNISNAENAEKSLKLVEVIPKAFAESSELISSEEEFNAISSDPIIQFNAIIPAQGETEIEYYLAKPLTKEEAEAFIANNVIQSFTVPSLLFNADQEISPATFEATTSTQSPSGLFSGLNLSGIVDALKPLGIIIVIVVVIALIGYGIRNREGAGNYPLANPKFSSRLKSHEQRLEPKKEQKTPKWGVE